MNETRIAEIREAEDRARRYVESLDGKSDLRVGPAMTRQALEDCAAALTELLGEVERLEAHIKLHAGDTLSLSNDVEIAREDAEFQRGIAEQCRKDAAAAEAMLAKAKEALQWFVDRCDRGEVRSVLTATKFREIISEIEES